MKKTLLVVQTFKLTSTAGKSKQPLLLFSLNSYNHSETSLTFSSCMLYAVIK